jgi:hypothetical protein
MIGVRFPMGVGKFYLRHHVQTGSGAHPASYPIGTGGSFHGGKVAGREADHSPSSSAKVKERVELYLHSQIRLHAVVLKLSTGTTLPLPYLYLHMSWHGTY